MQKLIKNWIFTLIVCILLALLTAVMFLGAFEVKGFTLAQDILHLLMAVILGIYIVLGVFPMIIRYRGTVRIFVGLEIVLLILAVVALTFAQVNMPFFSSLQVCSVVGLALWARGAVETVHAYLLQGSDSAKKIPLWALGCYILLCAFGMWQLARPSIADKHFLFVIGGVSFVMAAIFAWATAQNRRGMGKGKSRKKKAAKAKKAGGEDVAFFPVD
ncbi:MAG: hypothetical protein IJC99_00730 [Clostridia bacterium]|nr:hypothetical protein [Clostridia bacterium]